MINILTAISSVVIIILYSIYFTVTIIQSNGFTASLLPVIVICAALMPVIFRKRIPRWLRVLFCAGMCFYTVSFAVFCPVVLSAGANYSREVFTSGSEGQIILVHGCRTYDYTPSDALASRLDTAIELLNEHPDALCIVSGGVGVNGNISEAESMRAYLEERGISGGRIFKEDKSHSTDQNIRFSLEVMEREGLFGYSVVSVSNEFHLLRIRLIAKSYGLQVSGYPAPSPSTLMLMHNLVREYMSYVKMILLSPF